MPTALRGYVPAVRAALRQLIWGLRLLEGRCVNEKEAVSLGIEPGSTPLPEEDIAKSSALLIGGLSEMEGVIRLKGEGEGVCV